MIAPIDMKERNPKDWPKNERKSHDLIGKKRVRSLTKIYLIFLSPKKTETNVHDIFYTKHCLSDISGFASGNPYLYFIVSFYFHVQVYKYKVS